MGDDNVEACMHPEGQESTEGMKKKLSIREFITMEPMWLGIMTAMAIGFSAFQNLFIERACTVDLGYSHDECFHSNVTMKKQIEMESQQTVTGIAIVTNSVGGLIICLVLLFLGPWSDSSGRRKPVIILPLVGMLSTSVGILILQAFPEASAAWALYIVHIPLSIGGSGPMLALAAMNYLGDICYKTGRCLTTIMGSNNAVISFASIVGSLLSPVLLKCGFVTVFSVSCALEIFSLLYVFFKVKDVNVAEKIPSFLNMRLPLDALKCLLKKREGKKRRNIMLMVFLQMNKTVIFATEISILYLYLRYKYEWNEVEFGIYSAIKGVVNLVGSIVIVKWLKHKVEVSDETIGIIAGLSQMLAILVLFFSTQPWMVFLSPIVGIFSSGARIAEKPVINKQIVGNEQGKIGAIIAILDKLSAFVIIPLVQFVYYKTVSWMPGCFLLLNVLAAIYEVICFYCITYEKEKIEDHLSDTNEDDLQLNRGLVQVK